MKVALFEKSLVSSQVLHLLALTSKYSQVAELD